MCHGREVQLREACFGGRRPSAASLCLLTCVCSVFSPPPFPPSISLSLFLPLPAPSCPRLPLPPSHPLPLPLPSSLQASLQSQLDSERRAHASAVAAQEEQHLLAARALEDKLLLLRDELHEKERQKAELHISHQVRPSDPSALSHLAGMHTLAVLPGNAARFAAW